MVILDTIWTRRKRISDQRLAICKTCEHLDQKRLKCRKCGCFMEFKSHLPYVECPIGKWGSINIDDVDMSQEN